MIVILLAGLHFNRKLSLKLTTGLLILAAVLPVMDSARLKGQTVKFTESGTLYTKLMFMCLTKMVSGFLDQDLMYSWGEII